MSLSVTLLVLALAAAGRAARLRTRALPVRRRLAQIASAAPAATAGLEAHPLVPPERVRAWLEDAGVGSPPAVVWTGWVGTISVATLAALVLAGPATGGLVLVLGTAAPGLFLRTRRGQGQLLLERALPAALEAVARSLRSGASLRQAVAEAGAATPGRLGRELVAVARQVERGATLVSALEALAARHPAPGVRLTVAALCLGVETGGAQARAVDGVAATLRDRSSVAAEVRALSSQARISALVIGLAPLAFGAFAMATDPRTGQFVFHTSAGLAILAVGCTLDGLGWLWMQRLARVPA